MSTRRAWGTGLIPGRNRDRFGAAYHSLSLSDDLVDDLHEIAAQIGNPSDLLLDDEDGFELFYEVAVTG